MAIKSFGNQTAEQVASHLKAGLGDCSFNLRIDTFSGVAQVTRSAESSGHSHKIEKLRNQLQNMQPKKRRQALSAKRREKPKLKHVRNGRAITLKGYTGFFIPKQGGDAGGQ